MQKKRESFQKLAGTINLHTSLKYMWDKAKIFKNKLIKINPKCVSENLKNEKKIMTSLNKLCPEWVQSDPSWLPICKSNGFFDVPFDFVEYNIALNSRNNSSSPGMDGINYEVLKHLLIKLHLILLDIFNEMYKESDYPCN